MCNFFMIFFKLVSFPLCVIIILQERVKRTTSEIRLCHDRENGGPKYLLLAHGNHVRGIRSARIGSARMEATRYSPSLVLISFFFLLLAFQFYFLPLRFVIFIFCILFCYIWQDNTGEHPWYGMEEDVIHQSAPPYVRRKSTDVVPFAPYSSCSE